MTKVWKPRLPWDRLRGQTVHNSASSCAFCFAFKLNSLDAKGVHGVSRTLISAADVCFVPRPVLEAGVMEESKAGKKGNLDFLHVYEELSVNKIYECRGKWTGKEGISD